MMQLWEKTNLTELLKNKEHEINLLKQEIEKLKSENQALKNDSIKHKIIAENSFDWIYWLNTKNEIEYCSPACERITGISYDQFIGNKELFFKIIHPDDFEKYLSHVTNSHLNHTDSLNGDIRYRIVSKSGEVKHLHHICIPIYNDQGNYLGRLSGNRDITEHVNNNDLLFHSRQRYKLLAETISDFIWEVDKNGRYTYVNPKVESILGYTPDDMLGKTPFDFMPQYEADRIQSQFLEILAIGGEIKSLININIHKNGSKVYLETSGLPYYDENGTFSGYRGVDRDVTKRILAEQSASKENERARSVIEVTSNGVWDWNMQTNQAYFSDRYFTMLGYEPNEFPSTFEHWRQLVHPDDIEAAESVIFSHIQNNLPIFETDFRLKCKDGSSKWIHAVGKIIEHDEDGKPSRMLGVHIDIDRQKREHEEQLLLLSSAVRSATNGIVVTDASGTIEYANPAFLELTQYSLEEALGKNPRELVNSGTHSKEFFKIMWETIKSGKSWQGEITNRRKDGVFYIEELTITPVRNTKGEITNFIAVKLDISEKKNIIEKLNQSKTELQAIYDNSPVMICVLDENIMVKYANKALTEFVDEPVDNLFGRRACGAFGCINRDSSPLGCGFGDDCSNCKLNKAIIETLETGISNRNFEHEASLLQGNDIYTYVLLCSTALVETNGSRNVLLNMLDITDRKQTELALARNEQMFRAYVQNAPFGIFVASRDFRIGGSNKAITELLAYNEEELFGKSMLDLFDSGFHEGIKQFVNATNYDKNLDEEMLLLDKNGNSIWCQVLSVALLHGEILVFCQDIRTRKIFIEEQNKLLEEIKLSKETIEASLYQKTTLIDELEKSKADLKEALLAKDKFFSIIAHDLRGPFSGFLGLSDMMAKDLEELSIKDMKKMSRAIFNSATTVFQLLNDLLQWAHTQLGSIPFKKEKLDIYEIAFNTVFTLSDLIEKKELKVKISIPTPTYLDCDRNMTTTIVRNLVSNSVKFTKRGGSVEIGIAKISENYAKLFVKDTGIGISKENIEKLFKLEDHFTSLGTDNESGSGLGLILCREFVEKHSGTIEVVSELNKGTTFYFLLPIFAEESVVHE